VTPESTTDASCTKPCNRQLSVELSGEQDYAWLNSNSAVLRNNW
jgi:hypothetical protein